MEELLVNPQKTKVLLINPPLIGSKHEFPRIGVPLGILQIASVLEKNGKDIEVFDSLTYSDKLEITDLDEDSVLFGASWDSIINKTKEFKPDYVGIPCQFSILVSIVLKLSKLIKDVDKNIKVIIGANPATANFDIFLDEPSVDFVIMAEGEYTLNDLIDCLSKNKDFSDIPNLVYRKDNKVFKNAIKFIHELDDLPFPAIHHYNLERYFEFVKQGMGGRILTASESERQFPVITSRGCPYFCNFCSIFIHMGRTLRKISSKRLLDYLELLVKKYNVNHISFEDDNLTLDLKNFEEILDGLIERKLNITWDTPNGVRANLLEDEIVAKVKKAGCTGLKIGVESGNQYVLDKIIVKGLRLENVIKMARLCHKHKVPLSAFFIIGFPGENKKMIQETLDFAYRLKKQYDVNPILHHAIPLPGTALYKLCEEKNYLVKREGKKSWFNYGEIAIKTEEFNPDYLKNKTELFYRKILFLEIFITMKSPLKMARYINMLTHQPKKFLTLFKRLFAVISSA